LDPCSGNFARSSSKLFENLDKAPRILTNCAPDENSQTPRHLNTVSHRTRHLYPNFYNPNPAKWALSVVEEAALVAAVVVSVVVIAAVAAAREVDAAVVSR